MPKVKFFADYKYIKNILYLVAINIKIRYRETWIGFIWVLLNPILLYSVQAFIFTNVLKNHDGSYLTYLMKGLFPWFFLSQTAEMSCTHVKNNSILLKNLQMHPFTLVLTLVIENYFNFISSVLIVSLFLLSNQLLSFADLLLFLGLTIPFFIVTLCISFISSLLHTIFKDFKYISHFLFTLLYFLTPTFYSTENIPSQYKYLIQFNPFYWMIDVFRININQSLSEKYFSLGVFISILIFLGFLCIILWKNLKNKIYLRL